MSLLLMLLIQTDPTFPSEAATSNVAVYFSAPLYRKNLHYKILPKPSSSSTALKVMSDYILTNHKDDSGIVYCFSKKVGVVNHV